jgi:hypothetical protein
MEALEVAVQPLDAARRAFLRLATKSALLTRILGKRDSRVLCMATLQVTVLFALAIRAPVALFFVGPLLLGVSHLAADVRYLAVRRDPSRALVYASIGFAVAITLARVLVDARVLRVAAGDRLDVGLGALWVGAAAMLAMESRRARAATLAVTGFAVALLLAHAHSVGLVLVHGHNLVAIAAWALLYRRGRLGSLLPILLVVVGTAALLSGVFLPSAAAHGALEAFGARASALGAWLAPWASAQSRPAVLMAFVFLQGVHYAAWTGWIPQDDLRGEGSPTYRMTLRGLLADFGPAVLGALLIGAIAFLALGVWDVRRALGWYMTLAKSHGWFELAFLTHFALRGACAQGKGVASFHQLSFRPS